MNRNIKIIFKKFLTKTFAIIEKIIGKKKSEKLKKFLLNIVRKKNKIITLKKDLKRLQEISKTKNNLKIHFGCGPRILKNWINIDISYEPNWNKYYSEESFPKSLRGGREDLFIINFTEGSLPIPNNSVDIVFSEDFIEHLDQQETIMFLSETLRILKTEGVHRINTPDLISSMGRHSDFTKGLSGIFTNEWNKNGHKNILTKNYLKELAEMIGYKKIIFTNKNGGQSKSTPPEIRPGHDRTEKEQIYCDLIK